MKLRTLFTGVLMLMMGISFAQDAVAYTPDLADGEKTFKTRCTACHKLDARLVGPALKGVTERRSEEWLLKFIHNSTEFIASGDADAVALFEEFNKMPMIPNTDLSDDQIRNVLAYIDPPVIEEAVVEEAVTEVAVEKVKTEEKAPVVVEKVKKEKKKSAGTTMGLSPVVTYLIIGLLLIVLLLLFYFTATFNQIMKDRKS